jgi:hypothetical protein
MICSIKAVGADRKVQGARCWVLGTRYPALGTHHSPLRLLPVPYIDMFNMILP